MFEQSLPPLPWETSSPKGTQKKEDVIGVVIHTSPEKCQPESAASPSLPSKMSLARPVSSKIGTMERPLESEPPPPLEESSPSSSLFLRREGILGRVEEETDLHDFSEALQRWTQLIETQVQELSQHFSTLGAGLGNSPTARGRPSFQFEQAQRRKRQQEKGLATGSPPGSPNPLLQRRAAVAAAVAIGATRSGAARERLEV